MSHHQLQIKGTARIDGTTVGDATVPVWAVDEVVADGPVEINIEAVNADDQATLDADALSDLLVSAAQATGSTADALDYVALRGGQIPPSEWADVRGTTEETVRRNAAQVDQVLNE